MVLPPLQAFLLPSPHLCDLQMEQGPAQQHRRLSQLLQSAVFPEFVSAPAPHTSCSSPTSARAHWGHPGVLRVPQSPAGQAQPAGSNRIHLQSWHREGGSSSRDRDTAGAQPGLGWDAVCA